MRVRLHYQINTSHFSYLFLLLSCVHTGSTSLIEHCFVLDVSWPFSLWLPTTPPPDCEHCCLSPAPPQPGSCFYSSTTAKGHRNHDSAIEGSLYASSSNNRHLSHSWSSRQNTSRRISKDLFFHLSSLKLTFKFSGIQILLRRDECEKKGCTCHQLAEVIFHHGPLEER